MAASGASTECRIGPRIGLSNFPGVLGSRDRETAKAPEWGLGKHLILFAVT